MAQQFRLISRWRGPEAGMSSRFDWSRVSQDAGIAAAFLGIFTFLLGALRWLGGAHPRLVGWMRGYLKRYDAARARSDSLAQIPHHTEALADHSERLAQLQVASEKLLETSQAIREGQQALSTWTEQHTREDAAQFLAVNER